MWHKGKLVIKVSLPCSQPIFLMKVFCQHPISEELLLFSVIRRGLNLMQLVCSRLEMTLTTVRFYHLLGGAF